MKWRFLPFLLFWLFLTATFFVPVDFNLLVLPGIHLTVLPVHFAFSLVVIVVLLLVVAGYWRIAHTPVRFRVRFYLLHLVLTVATVIPFWFPGLFYYFFYAPGEWPLNATSLQCIFSLVVLLLFFVAQIVFGANYYKGLRKWGT
ncbi:hypothetical protein [Paraflavitalea pollutisoli]|uniref:hypothetical protein n=1 Tax=Paraflavitalea pollutisoli TaxID=3034143 RepID=UPI0023EBFAD3|nr:hypothetical protein [Paraflavitalea sp. H1-2-19X]